MTLIRSTPTAKTPSGHPSLPPDSRACSELKGTVAFWDRLLPIEALGPRRSTELAEVVP